ncbi:MAG: hypothetical protein KC917_08970 [Candidatus Omnitrophica bacterium]|nr:hypothetical protein [Candidatus Omnitrophota bacterium]
MVLINGAFWTLFILFLTPFLFFGLLSTCYRSSLRHSLTVSPGGAMAFLIFFLGCLTPSFADYREGHSNIEFLGGQRGDIIIASHRDGDRLLTVEAENKGSKRSLHLRSRKFNGRTLETISSVNLFGDIKTGFCQAFLTEDRLLINEGQKRLTLFEINDPEKPRIVRKLDESDLRFSVQRFKQGFVLVNLFDRDRIQNNENSPPRYKLDLSTGTLTDVEASELRWVGQDFRSERLFGKGSPFELDHRWGESVGIVRVDESGRTPGPRFDDLEIEAVRPGLIVGFNRIPVVGGKPIEDNTRLVLMDMSDPMEPKKTVIDLPLRLRIPLYQNFIDLSKPAIDAKKRPIALQVALGEKYLLVYSQEMTLGAWDVGDPAEPVFLGLADIDATPIPDAVNSVFGDSRLNSYAPFRRDDGALGYLTSSARILWLEFPALMKEANAS